MRLLIAFLFVLSACNPTLRSPVDSEVVMIDETGWTIVWSDEFSGPAGAPVNADFWTYETGGHGFGNQQLEFNTDRTDNAQLDGMGNLVITAKREQYLGREYTSARLNTHRKVSQQYGRIVARAKMPEGTGLWPAIWLLGDDYETNTWPNCGEIDIMEMRGQNPNTVLGSLHGPGYSAGSPKKNEVAVDPSLSEEFHLFSVIWTPESIEWFVDDIRYHRVQKVDFGETTPWVFDAPFFLILNLAVGGQFVGPVGSRTVFPAEMLVDFVRIYEPVDITE